MTVVEKIERRVRILPTPMQAEVSHFVEFLLTKIEAESLGDEDQNWANIP